MGIIGAAILTILFANCYYCSISQPMLDVSPGIYSTETVSNELNLSATQTTFQPVTNLTATIHVSQSSSVFVHYQITLRSTNASLYTRLTMNNKNAGSLVHSGLQIYETATGFYMDNLESGNYTFQVQ